MIKRHFEIIIWWRVNELRHGWTSTLITSAQINSAEVHSLVPKLLPCRSYSCLIWATHNLWAIIPLLQRSPLRWPFNIDKSKQSCLVNWTCKQLLATIPIVFFHFDSQFLAGPQKRADSYFPPEEPVRLVRLVSTGKKSAPRNSA